MGSILLTYVAFIAMAVLLDWAFFGRMIRGLPRTPLKDRAYRDYFFPRVLFIMLAGAVLAFGTGFDQAGRTVIGAVGMVLFLGAHCIQYYWFFNDR